MKTILHLCADIGSDSYPYQLDDEYNVILIGKEIGVENYHPNIEIHGIIANPVCTQFSTVSGFHKTGNLDLGMFLVNHCLRIINEAVPKWWVLENPFNGRLKEKIGYPKNVYQPWNYGSPWTKKTALWGNFKMPLFKYTFWEDVQKNENLYIRPGRKKPQLAFLHKSAIYNIPEFAPFIDKIHDDNGFRSLCSQGFANSFKDVNP